jgi:glycosyltransferase involved in cell wall biosynthesis
MKLSVVIPVYNEKKFILEILKKVQSININKEIIVIDDYSTDGTREILKDIKNSKVKDRSTTYVLSDSNSHLKIDNIKIIFQKKNSGKGAALKRGFKEAGGEVIVVQDADLEYNPEEYYKLIEPINENWADVVYGSRFLGGPHRVLYFWHYVANKFLTLFSNMLTNINLSDMETCYKMFRKEVLEDINIQESRFGFEPEITAKVAKGKWRIYEVPISYYGRTYEEGKKIDWKDGIKAIWCIIRYGIFG